MLKRKKKANWLLKSLGIAFFLVMVGARKIIREDHAKRREPIRQKIILHLLMGNGSGLGPGRTKNQEKYIKVLCHDWHVETGQVDQWLRPRSDMLAGEGHD